MKSEVMISVPYGKDLFYETPFGILLSDFPLRSGTTLSLVHQPLTNPAVVPFELFLASDSGDHIGYVIRPSIHYKTLGTGVILYYNSWFQNSKPLTSDEVFLALKLPSLYAYTAINKITVLTTPDLSDSLHDYLTML
jgi:hypothetical protein